MNLFFYSAHGFNRGTGIKIINNRFNGLPGWYIYPCL